MRLRLLCATVAAVISSLVPATYGDTLQIVPTTTLAAETANNTGTADAFVTQTNVAGLVVRHIASLYTVGDGSEAVTVHSYLDSGGSCVALAAAQVYSTIAIPLWRLDQVPSAPLVPFSLK